MNSIRSVLVGLLLSICYTKQIVYAQDGCADLLRFGIFNQYRYLHKGASFNNDRANFCSAYESYKTNKNEAALSASYQMFTGSAQGSTQQMEALATSTCSGSSSETFSDSEIQILQTTVDPNIVNGYNDCKKLSSAGLKYKIATDNENPNWVQISLYFAQGPGSAKDAQVRRVEINTSVPGQKASCSGDLYTKVADGRPLQLTNEVVTMNCTRAMDHSADNPLAFMGEKVLAAPVIVTVDTNIGPVNATFSKVPLKKPAPDTSIVPIGTVISFAGLTPPPPGWKLCNGESLKIAEYPDLFKSLQNTYGGNVREGTFNLPDYRGRFLRGLDDGANRDQERANLLTQAGLQRALGHVEGEYIGKHNHAIRYQGEVLTVLLKSQFSETEDDNRTIEGLALGKEFSRGPSFVRAVTSPSSLMRASEENLPYETRPINSAVRFIIRVQ
ncbi:MAG: tail fiber protein [Bryobacter sp.]|nr:tail fiber protein [Bryobacter sp.]